jgi:hypothetical protein
MIQATKKQTTEVAEKYSVLLRHYCTGRAEIEFLEGD